MERTSSLSVLPARNALASIAILKGIYVGDWAAVLLLSLGLSTGLPARKGLPM
jgi:hypothetical protein